MKAINVVIHPFIARALSARYDVPKLQSALDADYNNVNRKAGDDETLAVNTKEAGISSARAKEGKAEGSKGEFKAVDIHKVERSGVLNNPRRMTAWLVAFAKFVKTNGEPSGELTPDVLPASLIYWLETKFLLPEFQAKEGKANVGKRPKAEKPAINRGITPAADATANAVEAK